MYLPTFYVNVRKYFKSIMNSVKSYFGKDFLIDEFLQITLLLNMEF